MPFVPQRVFEHRAARIRQMLSDNDMHALIVTTPDNFYMVSGFHLDVAPWERPVAAVIPRDGDPFLIMNSLSTNHLRMADERGTLFIRDYDIYLEHPRSFPRSWTREQWGKLLATRLESRGITRGRLAVEGSGPVALQREMPGVAFVDVTRYLVEMRQIKYPEELDIMRLCGALTDWGQDRYMEQVRPGMVVTAFDFDIARQIAEEGARLYPEDRLEVRIRSSSGASSSAPHGSGANCAERFEQGDSVVNIIICRLNGLVVENERTLFVGQPRSEEQIGAFQVATRACVAAGEQMYVGNTVANADAAAQRVIEEAGYAENIMHRTGHGMGIAGHEFPEDMAFLYRPFMENEVYSCEPGIYIYGLGGFRHDDTIIVTRDGPEIITNRSKALEDQIAAV
jgi:Xaa-Pro aminopeptidase